MKEGYVYILTNRKRTVLYTGVTSDLVNRVLKHKKGEGSEFTKKYEVKNLVYYESHQNMYEAIRREKQIKKWKREWKLNLIRANNPDMKDLWKEITSGGRFHF
ncbi:GIY-YIG nuclease family protein [Gracilimonas sp.]|uniref:GIY-YIG nuclease family protein n=1 Tax=Gracilimonas sp. TaxID=1974203 RepID=UPI0032EF2C08